MGTGLAAFMPQAAARRIIQGRSLGLVPRPGVDQTQTFRDALREAASRDAWLGLEAGEYLVGELDLDFPVRIIGRKGTRLTLRRNADFLLYVTEGPLLASNVSFLGAGNGRRQTPLVQAEDVARVELVRCILSDFDGDGLALAGCSGSIVRCRFSNLSRAALFSENGKKLRILHNRVSHCGDNGILVWQSDKGHDGSIVAYNHITNIRAESGGDGPYGNGINVFKANGVRVEHNRIFNCAFSAVRNHSGDDCRIIGNICEDLGEVAIFVEFEWKRAIVKNNRIRRASAGITATNMDHGGRDAEIIGNIVADLSPRISSVDMLAYGIQAEADTLIANNLVRNAEQCGLLVGWGPYLDNVRARNNLLEDCGHGIAVSVVEGAGDAYFSNNTIARPRLGGIVGYDHERPVTGDFLAGTRPPAHVHLSGNRLLR